MPEVIIKATSSHVFTDRNPPRQRPSPRVMMRAAFRSAIVRMRKRPLARPAATPAAARTSDQGSAEPKHQTIPAAAKPKPTTVHMIAAEKRWARTPAAGFQRSAQAASRVIGSLACRRHGIRIELTKPSHSTTGERRVPAAGIAGKRPRHPFVWRTGRPDGRIVFARKQISRRHVLPIRDRMTMNPEGNMIILARPATKLSREEASI